jgi:hypothetical protein
LTDHLTFAIGLPLSSTAESVEVSPTNIVAALGVTRSVGITLG